MPDCIDDLLQTMRMETSLYVRVALVVPYAYAFVTGDEPRLLVVHRGSAWLVSDTLAAPLRVSAGDALIVRPGTTFALKDDLARPEVRVECTLPFSENGRVLRYGEGPGDVLELICSRFSASSTAPEPVFVTMPAIAHVRLGDPHADLLRATLKVIELEAIEDRLGGVAVMSRLLDVLFVQAIRGWFASEDVRAAAWLEGPRDPRVAGVVREMQGDLARPWTVEALARTAGMSRSSFAALFKSATGMTPLEYLTAWRICRSKSLLRQSELSVSEIAAQVGYDTDMALIRAFKRSEGMPPGEWRRAASQNL